MQLQTKLHTFHVLNFDFRALFELFDVVVNTIHYLVSILSNSTISDFNFSETFFKYILEYEVNTQSLFSLDLYI